MAGSKSATIVTRCHGEPAASLFRGECRVPVLTRRPRAGRVLREGRAPCWRGRPRPRSRRRRWSPPRAYAHSSRHLSNPRHSLRASRCPVARRLRSRARSW